MPQLVAVCLGWLALVLLAGEASAQVPAPGRPGPYVVDVRMGTSSLPSDATFFPPLPTGTLVPARNLGVELGAHVYLISVGPARVGVGASVMRGSGRSSPPAPASASGSGSRLPTTPAVEARVTTIAPQLSFNFGTDEGWSYLSLGVGRAEVEATASAYSRSDSTGMVEMVPEAALDTSSLRSVNIGGGARWFTNRHFAVSFDVRFHLLSPGRGDVPTPGTTLVVVSAGMSLK